MSVCSLGHSLGKWSWKAIAKVEGRLNAVGYQAIGAAKNCRRLLSDWQPLHILQHNTAHSTNESHEWLQAYMT